MMRLIEFNPFDRSWPPSQVAEFARSRDEQMKVFSLLWFLL